MPKQQSVGWPFPGGMPQGGDWTFLNRTFADLAKHLGWPFVSGAFSGTAALNITAINFTPDNDESSLYRTATDRIYAPQDFSSYLAVGAAGAIWTTTGTNRTNLIWNKSTIATVWGDSKYSDAATVRGTVKLFEPMNKGEFLTLSSASSGAGTNLTTAKFGVVFIPLR